MDDVMTKKIIISYVSIDDGGCGFSTTVIDAKEQAESELAAINETVDSIKELNPNCDKLDAFC